MEQVSYSFVQQNRSGEVPCHRVEKNTALYTNSVTDHFFVTHNEECWKLQSSSISLVPELKCSHKEADTRMILHAKHIQGPVLIHADNTDVLVLLRSGSNVLGDVYMKTGRGSKSRIIQIKWIVENLTKDLATGIRVQDF